MTPRVRRIMPVALSANALATALGIPNARVYEAVKSGVLPMYQHGVSRRILIVDAVEWVRNHWKRRGEP